MAEAAGEGGKAATHLELVLSEHWLGRERGREAKPTKNPSVIPQLPLSISSIFLHTFQFNLTFLFNYFLFIVSPLLLKTYNNAS